MCSSRIDLESSNEWPRYFKLELEWRCLGNSRKQTVAGIINRVSWIKSAKGSPANDLNWPLNYMTPCQYDSIWAFDERAHLLPICPGSKRLRVVQKMRNRPVWGCFDPKWGPQKNFQIPGIFIRSQLYTEISLIFFGHWLYIWGSLEASVTLKSLENGMRIPNMGI